MWMACEMKNYFFLHKIIFYLKRFGTRSEWKFVDDQINSYQCPINEILHA